MNDTRDRAATPVDEIDEYLDEIDERLTRIRARLQELKREPRDRRDGT